MARPPLDLARCPHCRADLARPAPRACPACGGLLQQRYLTAGCLTSAPKLLALAAAGWSTFELVRALSAR
jgi:hypothetical protein